MKPEISVYTHIYIPIIIWLVLNLILVFFMIVRYTFGKWTPDNPNPYETETLSLPRGAFRAILTMSLLYIAVLFEIYLLAVDRPETNITEFMTAFQMMIAFYFGAKVAHHVSSTNRSIAQFKAEASAGQGSTSTVSSTPLATAPLTTTVQNTTTPSEEENAQFDDSEAAG